jgi:integrase
MGKVMQIDDRWQWPIPLDEYDIISPLTHEETHTINELLCLRDNKQRRIVGYAEIALDRLPRLVMPIHAALDYANFSVAYRSPVVYRFLEQMADTGTVYGCIPDEKWLPMLNGAVPLNGLKDSVVHKSQQAFLTTLYLLNCFKKVYLLHKRQPTRIARTIFGDERVDNVLQTVTTALEALGYHAVNRELLQVTLSEILLAHRSPCLTDVDLPTLAEMRATNPKQNSSRFILRLSYALFGLGILATPLPKHPPQVQSTLTTCMWNQWVERWKMTSTLEPATQKGIANILRQVGIWLRRNYPHIQSPEQWDRQTCLDFVTAVSNLQRGDWTETHSLNTGGELLQASTRRKKIDAVRKFFQDLQAWEWIPKQFNPNLSLTAPTYLHAQIGPNPRIIAREAWAKLLEATLNLNEEDIQPDDLSFGSIPLYPLEMVRAVALVWIFGGLRNDEIRRLQVGCVRWDDDTTKNVVPLRVPANKTSGRFEKPVSRIAAEAIREWECVRPEAPPLLDRKSGNRVHFLFLYRGRQLGQVYLNRHLIPLLCRKAQIPLADAKGKITSHRARATIGNALVTGENAMTLLQLKTWLGHRSIQSTLHYVKPSPTRIAQAYTDTDYFERNLRMVDVLLDQNAILAGVTDNWLHYDLGHGYCSNDFFVKCAHRMACARCSFYLPKASSKAQMLEASTNIRHMMQEVELTDEEIAATEGDVAALERLIATLETVTTPDRENAL